MSKTKTIDGKFKCVFCEQDFTFPQSLYRHQKESCKGRMNPEAKKRRADGSFSRSATPSPTRSVYSDDEVSEYSGLSTTEKDATKAFEKLMKSNCNEPFVVKVFEGLDPIPKGMLHQMFIDKNDEYEAKRKVFEKDTSENMKVLLTLGAVDPSFKASSAEPPSASSSSASSSSASSSSASSSSNWYGFGGARK